MNENEPYVQEDGINAIGVLADITDLPFVEKYTLSSDPVIRSKAYKSLLQIDKENFLEKIPANFWGSLFRLLIILLMNQLLIRRKH